MTKVVIKIGTSTLTKNNSIDIEYIQGIASEISKLMDQGRKIIIVTSGAIGLGAMRMGISTKPRDIKLRQALAAIGQGILMHEYEKAFSRHNKTVAQLLLTYDVISERKTYLNLRNCIEELLSMGVIPIFNENDVVSIDEIGTKFGDNDRLSAMIAAKINADLLVIFSDIDGLYTANPKTDKNAKLISRVDKIDDNIIRMAGKAGSSFGSGGMDSKIRAAKIATEAGCPMVIVNGRTANILEKVLKGDCQGTYFAAKGKLSGKQIWIMNAKAKGKIIVNECAEKALLGGKVSLLPVGIVSVEGEFKKGEVVLINDLGRAVVDYDSKTILKVVGQKSEQACKILGKRCEIAKKENIVLG